MSALITKNLVKRFGGVQATDNVSLSVEDGQLHAIIGPNGAGKSTLIGQLAGEIQPDSGSVTLFEQDITTLPVFARANRGLARTYQITQLAKEFSVIDNILLATNAKARSNFRFWTSSHDDVGAMKRSLESLEKVGLVAARDRMVAELAHGEQRQLEIAMALATEPKVLLLDEPLAGMSQGESAAMIALLKSLKGRYPILLVEHDMDAVFALADRVSVLVYGRVIASGTPEEIRNNAEVRAAYLGEETSA
jgi:branched-chain amino acid transport system ATP-binding protein